MSKGKFWEHANTQALTAYDTVYASLAHLPHDVAHDIAMTAYQATITAKQTEYQNIVAVKKYTKKENIVLAKFRAEKISRPWYAQFTAWLTTPKAAS